ncbi:MAG TPA: hypothetical protein VFV75_13285 [Candidatus Polarisedimenticolaceae bacterium]|nr:hypothetical protein [Candidatus Polarisedimenticolaceae bacterium]
MHGLLAARTQRGSKPGFSGPIDTLCSIPRKETLVQDGINSHTHKPQPGGEKEWFFVERNGVTFGFWLYPTEELAKSGFTFGQELEPPTFREKKGEHAAYRLSYLRHQASHVPIPLLNRGDVDHGVTFRTYNLVTTVWFLGPVPDNKKLNWAVQELGRILTPIARQEPTASVCTEPTSESAVP